jgi:hypothetical protein
MAGWYAQKHPDEDFAETFAVWLTPRSQWRERYKGWGALAKLQYVDRTVRKVGDVEPTRRRGRTDITVDEMESTVGEFYRLRVHGVHNRALNELPDSWEVHSSLRRAGNCRHSDWRPHDWRGN